MTLLRTSILFVWLAVVAVTLWASLTLGLGAALWTFLGDLRHPWRAQFYSDLEAHLLLFGAWTIWRERSKAAGVACAAATLLLGALFTFPYLFVASFRSGGDMRRLLAGSHSKDREALTG